MKGKDLPRRGSARLNLITTRKRSDERTGWKLEDERRCCSPSYPRFPIDEISVKIVPLEGSFVNIGIGGSEARGVAAVGTTLFSMGTNKRRSISGE